MPVKNCQSSAAAAGLRVMPIMNVTHDAIEVETGRKMG